MGASLLKLTRDVGRLPRGRWVVQDGATFGVYGPKFYSPPDREALLDLLCGRLKGFQE